VAYNNDSNVAQASQFKNLVVRLGELHTIMASLGTSIDNLGINIA